MEEKLKQKPSNIIKIVLFGPESTGKTTLAKTLANYYQAEWVPEYMRTYLERKWALEKTSCELKDLLPIAEGQVKHENLLTSTAKKILFCDTNLLELVVYSEAYYNGYSDLEIKKYALENKYDLYFLTYIDIPWEADILRDKPNERESMFCRFEKALQQNNKNYVLLKGDIKTRMEVAIKHIDKLLNNR